MVVLSKNDPLARKNKLTLEDLQEGVCLEHGDEEIPFVVKERRSNKDALKDKSILV